MFDFVKGKLSNKNPSFIVIDNQGIGYKINITMRFFDSLITIGGELTVFTYFHVREDDQSLFGFPTTFERDLFSLLLSVSGVGPKLGLKILTETSPETLYSIIEANDLSKLVSIKGLGPKTAAKLLLDIKSKISSLDGSGVNLEVNSENKVRENTASALKNLGYKEADINKVLLKLFKEKPDLTLEEAIRETLLIISN